MTTALGVNISFDIFWGDTSHRVIILFDNSPRVIILLDTSPGVMISPDKLTTLLGL